MKVQSHLNQTALWVSFILLIIVLGCSNVPEGVSTHSGPYSKPAPNKPIYFLLDSDNQIFLLDPTTQKFDSIQISQAPLIDFTISANGNFLIAISKDSLFKYDFLNQRMDNAFALKTPASHRVSCSADGLICTYDTEMNGRPKIVLFYTDNGRFSLIDSDDLRPLWNPLLSPSARWLAYQGENSLLIRSLSYNPIEIELAHSSLHADSYSPSEMYLSAEGKIFDLVTMKKFPVERLGKILFIDELTLIWLPTQSSVLKKANLSGTKEQVLFETQNPIIDFALNPGKRFVVAVFPRLPQLVFIIYDYFDDRMEVQVSFNNWRLKDLVKLLWPSNPAQLTHEN